MTTITATLMLDETNMTAADISKQNLEYLIDNAINYVNLHAGQSMSNLTGTTPTMTVTITAGQAAVVKPAIQLLLMAYVDKGKPLSVMGITIQSVLSNPRYAVYKEMLDKGIWELKRYVTFQRV